MVNAITDANLAGFISSKPTLATSLFSIGISDNVRAGALYSLTPAPRIVYYLQGANQPCVIAGASGVTEGGVVTQCVVTL